jgi:hypothetical protein
MVSGNFFAQNKNQFVSIILLGAFILAAALPAPVSADEPAPKSLPALSEFIRSVADGNAGVLRGVYAAGVMAYPVVQQPAGNPAFVSNNPSSVTQFQMAADMGNIGLLAHNYFGGASFFDLKEGDVIFLVYGDGTTQAFLVEDIQRYQALDPLSPYSDFVDLETREALTAAALFQKVYQGEFHLTLQTCIANEGDLNWGRLFIIARPVGEKAADSLHNYN